MRVALAATHPIQYQMPWFRALAGRRELELEVGFAWLPDSPAQGTGFGVPFQWDVPLLEGYRSIELQRGGARPRLSDFAGLRLRSPAHWLAGRFDAVVVTGWNSWALVQVALAARRLALPVVVRGDSRGDRQRSLATRLAHRLLLRLYAAYLVVGRLNREFFLGYGAPAEKLFDCPHFVDNERFAGAAAAARADRSGLRARFGVPAEAVCALFAGKLQAVKNVDGLLTGLAQAGRAGADLHLLIVGDGEERARLAHRVAADGSPVRFAGFVNQSEMPAAYATADLLVLPSHSETWGLVVNEAMASGLPAVVSSAVGCAPDLVREGETGWSFPSGDVEALAARLGEAFARRAELPQMGARASAWVHERFSVGRAVAGTIAALESAVRGAARSRSGTHSAA